MPVLHTGWSLSLSECSTCPWCPELNISGPVIPGKISRARHATLLGSYSVPAPFLISPGCRLGWGRTWVPLDHSFATLLFSVWSSLLPQVRGSVLQTSGHFQVQLFLLCFLLCVFGRRFLPCFLILPSLIQVHFDSSIIFLNMSLYIVFLVIYTYFLQATCVIILMSYNTCRHFIILYVPLSSPIWYNC